MALSISPTIRRPNKEQCLVVRICLLMLAGPESINVRAMCEASGVDVDRRDSVYDRALALYEIMRDRGLENPGPEDMAHIKSPEFRIELIGLAIEIDELLAKCGLLKPVSRASSNPGLHNVNVIKAVPVINDPLSCCLTTVTNMAEKKPAESKQAPTSNNEKIGWQFQTIIIVMLLWALNPDNPYGYYMFLRLTCSAVFAFLGCLAWEQGQTFLMCLFFGALIVYNPIFSLHLTRDVWNVVNVVTVVFCFISIFWLHAGSGRNVNGVKWP